MPNSPHFAPGMVMEIVICLVQAIYWFCPSSGSLGWSGINLITGEDLLEAFAFLVMVWTQDMLMCCLLQWVWWKTVLLLTWDPPFHLSCCFVHDWSSGPLFSWRGFPPPNCNRPHRPFPWKARQTNCVLVGKERVVTEICVKSWTVTCLWLKVHAANAIPRVGKFYFVTSITQKTQWFYF